MKWRGTWCLVVSGSLHIWTCLPTLVQYNMLYDFLTWDSVWVLNLFLFFSLCFYRRNFAKSLIFPGWLRSSNDLKQICRYPSCKVFPARWLLHITFLFYGYSNFVYTWLFQQDCVRVYQALHRLPSFIEILAGYEGNHQGLIRDCFSTPLKVIYILSIVFVFVFCFVLFFLYLTPIMVWKVGLSTLFMFPYLGFNYTVSFQKLILKTSSTSSCLT